MSDTVTSKGTTPPKKENKTTSPASSGIKSSPKLLRKAKVSSLPTKTGVPSKTNKPALNIVSLSPSQCTSSQKKDSSKFSLRMSKKEFRGIMTRALLCLLVGCILSALAAFTSLAGIKIIAVVCVILAFVALFFAHPLILMFSYQKRIHDTTLCTPIKLLLVALPWVTYVTMAVVGEAFLIIGVIVLVTCFIIACFADGDPEQNGWGEPPIN